MTSRAFDAATLNAILQKLIDPKGPKNAGISPEEAEALVLIIDSGELKPEHKKAVFDQLISPRGMGAIVKGTGVELKPNDPKLASFHSVFAIKFTGNLKFYGKGTNLTYSPSQYEAVAQLVKDGKIKVVTVVDRGLAVKAGADAMYVPEENGTFFFFQHAGEADFFAHAPMIVHEVACPPKAGREQTFDNRRCGPGGDGDHQSSVGIRSRPALNVMVEPSKSSPIGCRRPPRC